MTIIHERPAAGVFGDVELTWLTDEQDDLWSLVTDGDLPPEDLAQ